MTSTIQTQLGNLPNKPGVYRYFDQRGKLLYIGKATSLKRRVSSYFQRPQEPRITELVRRIARISWTETDSVLEALFLEAYLIQSHQPPFNIRLKDDKTFAHIVLTKEDFPRILVLRPTQKVPAPIAHQFGPYTSTDLARRALTIVRRIFPFRTNCLVPSGSDRGCLDYQLGLCPGSCTGQLTTFAYRKQLRNITLFLEGKKGQLVKKMTREMNTFAKAHRFEQATMVRNQLFALQHIQDVALIKRETGETNGNNLLRRIEAYDISNIADQYAVASMVVISHGKIDKAEYRKFQIKTVVGQNDLKMMEEVLTRRFRHRDWPEPSLVVIDGGDEHRKVGSRVLNRLHLNYPIIGVAKGPARKNLDLFPWPKNLLLNPDLRTAIHLARDEAHRFAITYHRNRRDKGFLTN